MGVSGKLWIVVKDVKILVVYGDLSNPGIEPWSPTLQVDSLPAEPQGKSKNTGVGSLSLLQQIFPTQPRNQIGVSSIAGRRVGHD